MTPLLQRTSIRAFMGMIAGVGVLRFVLTVAGVPDNLVKYCSMTAVIMAGTVHFAVTTNTHRERLYVSFFLILPYMIVEVLALGYTWASGRATIFHSADYSLDLPLGWHLAGHLVGGLTWEPLFVFLLMELGWGIYKVVSTVILRK